MSTNINVATTETMTINQDNFLDYAAEHGFGDIHFKVDNQTGLRAIIAIHSTKLGPALGGCRFIHYNNPFIALYDAMRLSRAMSYKAASVNLPLGGGKAVLMKPFAAIDRESYFKCFGQFVETLNGRYITALDSGTTLDDMDNIGTQTKHVASLSHYNGEPSPYTALGIRRGIEAAVLFKLGKNNLNNLHIAIQGLGNVGYHLAKELYQLGAKLSVADVNAEAVARAVHEFNAVAVPTESIHRLACDVYAPCALGAILNDKSIPEIKASIVAGGANNQLAHHTDGQALKSHNILYAPDYVINAGGLIYAANRYDPALAPDVNQQIDHIYSSLLTIFDRADQESKPTNEIADSIAQEKLNN